MISSGFVSSFGEKKLREKIIKILTNSGLTNREKAVNILTKIKLKY